MQLIFNLFFFFALNPFFSPFPFFNTDSTPISHLLSFIIICLFALFDRSQLRLSLPSLLLLFFSLLSFSYVNPDSPFELRHRVGVIGAFLIYYVAYNFNHKLRPSVLKFSICFHSFFVFLHFFVPSLFIPIGRIFVRTIKITDFSLGRGASGMAAENSFSAALGLVYIVLLLIFFYRREISRFDLILYSLFASFCVIFSFSALGLFLSLMLISLYFCLKFFSKKDYLKYPNIFSSSTNVVLFLFASVLLFFVFTNISSTRGMVLLLSIIHSPSLFLLDGSLGERLIGISVGLTSYFHYPLGLGGGSYPIVASSMNDLYDIKSMYPNALYGIHDTVSSFGRYSAEFGLFFLFTYFILYYSSIKKRFFDFGVLALVLSFNFVLASFSILFPPTYLLIAFASLPASSHKTLS